MYNSLSGFSFRILITALIVSLYLFCNVAAAADSQFNAQKRYLYVQPGQNIFNIVQVLYPGQQKHWPAIIRKIVKKNPHAFIGADSTKIQTGERILLPAYSSTIKPVATTTKAVVYKGPQSVGQVIKSRGKTFAISKNKKRRNLDISNEVFVGDRIFTGVKGFVRLSMIDDAKIDLRCNSEMLIEDYRLLRGGNRSVLHLIKGSVRKITGSIGKVADDIYEMHTPLATVGVRGTEYAIRVLQSYGCDGSVDVNSQGLFVKVNRGAIDVKSKKQKIAMNKGEAAHLLNKESKLKAIDTRSGVFDSAGDNKKHNLFGSIYWLLLLAPVLLLLRLKR